MINSDNPDFVNTPVSSLRPSFKYEPVNLNAPAYVTIITPFYNTGFIFYETAESVLNQSFQQWEWLIINDGSTDPESLAILEKYRGKDPRIMVIDHAGNRGLSAARNTGFHEAKTEYVVQLDSDDLLEPTAVEKWLWFLESYPEYSFVKGFSVGFGSKTYLWQKGFHHGAEFLQQNLVDPPAMIRRAVHKIVGGFDEKNREGLEDWDFWLKCANQGYWGNTIAEYLNWYRRRPSHTDRWENLQTSKLEAFRLGFRQKYPKLWTNGFPNIHPQAPMPYSPISDALPCSNRLQKSKPRLLMIVPWLVMGGADKFNLDLVQQLTQQGWEVTIATTLKSDDVWQSEFARFTPDIFMLHRFLRTVDYPRFLRYLIQSRQVDAVLVSNSELGYKLLPYLRAHFPDLTFFDYCHIEEESWNNGGHPRASVQYQNLLDLNIVASQHLKNWMINRGAEKDRIEVCYINIDTKTWHPDVEQRAKVRKELGLNNTIPIIIYAARMVAQKQPHVFAETMRILSQKRVAFVSIAAGDGTDFSWLKEFVAQHQLGKQVRLPGAVPNHVIKELLVAADIFFLPSEWEGIALTFYEAMACGLAIVGADVGGQRELVTPDCGILIPRSSPDIEAKQYAKLLSELLSNKNRLRAMGQACRERVAQHFRIENMGKRMLTLINRAQTLHREAPRPVVSIGLGRSYATEAVEYVRLADLANQLYTNQETSQGLTIESDLVENILKATAILCANGQMDSVFELWQTAQQIAKEKKDSHSLRKIEEVINELMTIRKMETNRDMQQGQMHPQQNYSDKVIGKLNKLNEAPPARKPQQDIERHLQIKPPLVSVIIPCYKQAEFLPEAVESVVQQTFQEWELIIVNDGSPDNTSEVARTLIAKYPTKQISLLEKENGGLADARNFGIRASRGIYWLPLDADDKIEPTFLGKAVQVLEEHSDIGFVYSNIRHFGLENNTYYLPDFDADTIVHTDNIACVCALVRKLAWEEVGGYNPTMKEGYEDWDFWVGCIEKGWKGYRLPEALFWYRKKEATMLRGANLKREHLIARIVLNHPALYNKRRTSQAEFILQGKPEAKISSRVLIASTHFWPSKGGVETITENLGDQLVKLGYQVDVATCARPDRQFSFYRGITILSLDMQRKVNNAPLWVAQLRQLVISGVYNACIFLADPRSPIIWSIENSHIPSRTRILIQPIINQEGFEQWKNNHEFRRRLAALLKKATASIALSQNGVEAAYMKTEGVEPIYLPNAVDFVPATLNFRNEYRIPEDAFLILHVANLWEVKNHLELLETLHNLPNDWRLVMIGYPSGESKYVARVKQQLLNRPDVLYIPGLPADSISAAMETADVVILASKGEVSPLTIMEAMSHRKPWLATPTCGAVNEHTGGIVTLLETFPGVLKLLKERPILRQELGETGYKHWQACYTWTEAIKGWEELIETGRLQRTFDMPKDIADKMNAIRTNIENTLSSTDKTRTSLTRPPFKESVSHDKSVMVSVIIPTYNRREMLREAIRSVLEQTYRKFEIIVVNDAGVDVANVVAEMSKGGTIHYIQHEKNRGLAAARNTGIASARGKYIAYLDDDDIFYPDHLQTLIEFLESSEYKVAYTDTSQALQAIHQGKAVTVKQNPLSFPDFDYDVILIKNPIPVLCFMHEKSCLDETGLFDETLGTHEDWDLWIRMSRKFRIGHVKKITCEFRTRQGETQMTTSKLADFHRTREVIYRRYENYIHDKPNLIEAQKRILDEENLKLKSEHLTMPASVIIVTYNSASTIRACLDSVLQYTPGAELIVVDNASADKTQSILNEYGSRITKILNTENKGFSFACNQGIRASKGAYVILLNPDTVVTPMWAEHMLAHFKPGVGAVGPLTNYTTTTQLSSFYAKDRTQWETLKTNDRADKLYEWNKGQGKETKLLMGFCLALPRKVLDEVGLLNEDLFLGSEDLEISWRLRQKGYKLIIAVDSFIYHEGQVSFKSQKTSTSDLTQESADKLYAKLDAHYGTGNVPHPMELWGIDYFKPKGARFRSMKPSFAAVYCVYDDTTWLRESLESIYAAVNAVYFLLSDRPWFGQQTGSAATLNLIKEFPDPDKKIKIVEGKWTNEADQRNAGLDILEKAGFTYCFIVDADEIYNAAELKHMMQFVVSKPEVACWHMTWDTYWKTYHYRIDPREPFEPLVFLKVGAGRFTKNRTVVEGNHALIPAEVGICHHLSYARSDEEVLKKITTFSHAHEVQPGWFENVWKKWDADHSLTNWTLLIRQLTSALLNSPISHCRLFSEKSTSTIQIQEETEWPI